MRLPGRMRVVLPVLAAALLSAAPAAAAPRDAAFFRQLDADGVIYTDAFAILGYAHGICSWLDGGMPHLDVVDGVMVDQPQLDWDHAMALTVNAYLTYCPWHALPGTESEPGSRVAYA